MNVYLLSPLKASNNSSGSRLVTPYYKFQTHKENFKNVELVLELALN